MTSLAAAVAGLASGVEGAAVRGRAVAGDVTELAAGIALHGLSLAVAGEVVWPTALVAGGGTTASKSTPEAAKSSTGSASAAAHSSTRVGAVACQMAGEAAGVASSARAGAAQAESRAIGLDVTKALAVVALLSLGGARVRASVRLVARLLACAWISDRSSHVAQRQLTVVAESFRRGAHLCDSALVLCC